MRAIVTRHYKTLLNASDRIPGWGDSLGAKDWDTDITYVEKRLWKMDLTIDRIYSSNLERSCRTAMYFASSYGMNIVYDACELNEVNYGTLYKKSKKWVENNIPEHKTDPDFVYPKGESFRQMQTRSVAYLQSQADKFPDSTVLLVVHAGVIRGLISHFLGLDYAKHLKEKITHRYIGDFIIENGICLSYDEPGKTSGFVNSGALAVPWSATSATTTGKNKIISAPAEYPVINLR